MLGRVAAHLSKRSFGTAATFSQHGSPSSVLNLINVDDGLTPAENQVSIRVLASMVNPSDFNIIEGTYGKLPKLPAVAGKECVAVVEKVGANVKSLKVGDRVINLATNLGTWRAGPVITKVDDCVKVSNELPTPYAASLLVNPCTAYRMLKDFVHLQQGDVIIQNCSNSMVGLAVVQMAREMGIKTINVVRSDRPDADTVIKLLDNLGGTINVLDTYVNTANFIDMLRELPPIKLALNGTGGSSGTELLRTLGAGGTMVTYGGMSMRPMPLPVDVIVEKNLNVSGFWITRWYDENSMAAKQSMIDTISRMILDDKLTFFYEMHDFDDFKYALEQARKPYRLRKVVLNMDYPDRFAEHDKKSDADYWQFEAPAE